MQKLLEIESLSVFLDEYGLTKILFLFIFHRQVTFRSSRSDIHVTDSPVLLAPSSVLELPLSLTPRDEGHISGMVHVMGKILDSNMYSRTSQGIISRGNEQGLEVLETILIQSDAMHPIIGNRFELLLRYGSVVYKRIKLKNPYGEQRTFLLKSSHPHFISFISKRDSESELSTEDKTESGNSISSGARCELMAYEVRYVSLCFDLSATPGTRTMTGRHSVLIFINDERDRNEECFRIDLTVLS